MDLAKGYSNWERQSMTRAYDETAQLEAMAVDQKDRQEVVNGPAAALKIDLGKVRAKLGTKN